MLKLLMLLGLAAAPVQEVPWTDFNPPVSSVKWKPDTIKRKGDILTFWVRVDLSKDRSEKANYRDMRLEVDCDAETWRTLVIIDYNRNGVPIETLRTPYEEPTAPGPQTNGETIVRDMCRMFTTDQH